MYSDFKRFRRIDHDTTIRDSFGLKFKKINNELRRKIYPLNDTLFSDVWAIKAEETILN